MDKVIEGSRKPRERILSAARDLFRKHGVRGVGVDAIAEAAETNKMTLYRHFGSKDDLIAACLREVGEAGLTWWDELKAEFPGDPLGQLYGWVRDGAECVSDDGRGCDMANAAVELAECNHPARHVIEEFKIAQRNRLAELCREAGIEKADLLADTLSLLVEGARVNRQSVGVEGSCARLVAIGEAVISSFASQPPHLGAD
jgi:AcrR family transcriptional regulator